MINYILDGNELQHVIIFINQSTYFNYYLNYCKKLLSHFLFKNHLFNISDGDETEKRTRELRREVVQWSNLAGLD